MTLPRRLLSVILPVATAATAAVAIAAAVAPTGTVLRQRFSLAPPTLRTGVYRIVAEDPEQLREHIRQVFLSYVDQPREAAVDLAPTGKAELMQGLFAHMRFAFRDGGFEGISISRALLSLKGAVLDLGEVLLFDRLRFKSPGKVEFLLEISEAELNRFVFGARKLNVINPRIELRNESIRFSGKVKSGLGYTPVQVEGGFKIVGGAKIHFLPSRTKVFGVPIPGFVSREVFDRINPIADMERLKIKAHPDLIRSRRGRLFILTDGMKALSDP
jgi:hypothetical protein